MDARRDGVVNRHAGKPADLEQVAASRHLLGEIVKFRLSHLLEVDGDAPGAGLGHDAVEGDDDDARIAGLLDHAVQRIRRGRVDDDGIVALQDQVLDLGGLFRHLVLGGGEGVGSGHYAVGDGLLGHLVPALQHGLAPGVAGIVVGQRDLLVLGVGHGGSGRKQGGERDGAGKGLLEHVGSSRDSMIEPSGPGAHVSMLTYQLAGAMVWGWFGPTKAPILARVARAAVLLYTQRPCPTRGTFCSSLQPCRCRLRLAACFLAAPEGRPGTCPGSPGVTYRQTS